MKGQEQRMIDMARAKELPEGVMIESAKEQSDLSLNTLKSGYVLTRYFRDLSTSMWYVVLEKL